MGDWTVREHVDVVAPGNMACEGHADALSFCDEQWIESWAQAFLPDQGWERPLTRYELMRDGGSLGIIALAWQKLSLLRVASLAGYYWPFRTLGLQRGTEASARFATSMAEHFTNRPPGPLLTSGRFRPATARWRNCWEHLQHADGGYWHRTREEASSLNCPLTQPAYFSPSWTAFQAERGRDFSVIVDGVSD